MTNIETEKITKIVDDLLLEFQKEQNRIQSAYDNGVSRLEELQEDLASYKETEDVDFKVFSPRKVSTLNEEKLSSMDNEMKQIEEINKGLLKQLKYYSDKVDKLLVVHSILDGEVLNEIKREEKSLDSLFEFKEVSHETTVDQEEIINEGFTELSKFSEFDKDSLIDNLERLSHRIEISSKIIDSDVYRTKMELKSMKTNLDDIILMIK